MHVIQSLQFFLLLYTLHICHFDSHCKHAAGFFNLHDQGGNYMGFFLVQCTDKIEDTYFSSW